MIHYIQEAVRLAIGDPIKGIWPRLPKGCALWIRRSVRGEVFPHGVVSIRSKGRTGAAVRVALMRELRGRNIVLPKIDRRRRRR